VQKVTPAKAGRIRALSVGSVVSVEHPSLSVPVNDPVERLDVSLLADRLLAPLLALPIPGATGASIL